MGELERLLASSVFRIRRDTEEPAMLTRVEKGVAKPAQTEQERGKAVPNSDVDSTSRHTLAWFCEVPIPFWPDRGGSNGVRRRGGGYWRSMGLSDNLQIWGEFFNNLDWILDHLPIQLPH